MDVFLYLHLWDVAFDVTFIYKTCVWWFDLWLCFYCCSSQTLSFTLPIEFFQLDWMIVDLDSLKDCPSVCMIHQIHEWFFPFLSTLTWRRSKCDRKVFLKLLRHRVKCADIITRSWMEINRFFFFPQTAMPRGNRACKHQSLLMEPPISWQFWQSRNEKWKTFHVWLPEHETS